MGHITFLMACLLTISMGASAGEMFRWVDENGKVHYGDAPPSTVQAQRKKFGGNVEQNEDISFEARRAQENSPVTLYVSDTCKEPCTQARSLLRKRGVPYSETMLSTKSEIDAFEKRSGSSQAPTLAVGKNYLGGYSESSWNSELDAAGYPKTATYRQLIAPPPEPNSPKAATKPSPTTKPAAQ